MDYEDYKELELSDVRPLEIVGYTISVGTVFSGVTLHGFFKTTDEAILFAETRPDIEKEEYDIIPIWGEE